VIGASESAGVGDRFSPKQSPPPAHSSKSPNSSVETKIELPMTKWRSLIFGSTVALLLGLCLVPIPDRGSVNESNCAKIELGMTLTEVKSVLGEPTRSVRKRGDPECVVTSWSVGKNVIIVENDLQGQVIAKHCFAVPPLQRCLLFRLLWWLNRLE
jgi:hypothetical protein